MNKNHELNIIYTDNIKSNVLCWWCSHSYKTERKPIPIYYDSKKNIFSVHGSFCSWECGKAFMQEKYKSPSEKHTLFTLFLKRIEGKIIRIRPAPHWSELAVFGGKMTIENFRKNNNIIPFNPNSIISLSSGINHIREQNNVNKNPPGFNTIQSVSNSPNNNILNENKSNTNELVLKRQKPPRGRLNTLESTMGLIITDGSNSEI
tara:strand:- start:210 stop:824 length:615 start_codon:yes stop_codon:yes gene_type:complete